ncbi:hypothetical protein BGX38DRAFT_1270067 [Terfezia claveryi]|nr:hypothetical protein BGX38DRAFT_1270067 [Terfezia claveryi]
MSIHQNKSGISHLHGWNIWEPKRGCQSIVLYGGYKDDVDEGDTSVYPARLARVNKKTGARVAEVQSFDQTLDKTNAALAITMFPELTDLSKLDKV